MATKKTTTKKAAPKKAAPKKAAPKKAAAKRSTRRTRPIKAMTPATEEVTLEQALAESGQTMDDLKDDQTAKKQRTPRSESKSAKARAIFDEEWKKTDGSPVRKDVIARFIGEAGLTKAGASTYYFNIKKKMTEQ